MKAGEQTRISALDLENAAGTGSRSFRSLSLTPDGVLIRPLEPKIQTKCSTSVVHALVALTYLSPPRLSIMLLPSLEAPWPLGIPEAPQDPDLLARLPDKAKLSSGVNASVPAAPATTPRPSPLPRPPPSTVAC